MILVVPVVPPSPSISSITTTSTPRTMTMTNAPDPSSLLHIMMSSNAPLTGPESPVIDESLREEDPIEFLAQEVKVMDMNAIIK